MNSLFSLAPRQSLYLSALVAAAIIVLNAGATALAQEVSFDFSRWLSTARSHRISATARRASGSSK